MENKNLFMDIWETILNIIQTKIDQQTFDNWFRPIRVISLVENTFKINVPNKFFKTWFTEKYLPLLQKTLLDLTNKEYIFNLSYSKQNTQSNVGTDNPKNTENSKITNNISLGDNLYKNYSFDNFVVGNSNQFAHAASLAVANNPAKSYNPLFIYGGVGLGKTHLLNAIGNYIINKYERTCYISAENFMNALINSIRYDKMTNFRDRFRKVDLLLIDDIQFIAGKERTQEEFFHTFNSLHQSQKQIVLTSDKFPKEIPSLEERLRSRFEWGLIADIQPPEIETKIAILKSKASSNNISLSDAVALYLATNIKSNIRELEGCLIRVSAFASLAETDITLDIAKQVLKDILVKQTKEIGIDSIQKVVADLFKIKISDLSSNRKLKVITLPRQIAMYLSRKLTKCSFPEIGIFFGGKDHSTVIHAVNKIEKLIKSDDYIRDTVNSIKQKLEVE